MSKDKSADTTSEFRRLSNHLKKGKDIKDFKAKGEKEVEVKQYRHPIEIRLGRQIQRRFSTKQMKSIKRSGI